MTQFWRMEAYGDGVDNENDCIDCPWCGELLEYEISVSDTQDGDDESLGCPECERPVIVRTSISVAFTAFKAHRVRDVGRETTEQILCVDALEKFLDAARRIGNPVPF